MGVAMRAVFDSDVLIDYLQGLEPAKRELARYSKPEISCISWMEIMAGADDEAETQACRGFLSHFVRHGISEQISEEAVRLRRKHKLRLPDAIIWATARTEKCLFVTRNTKDFPKNDPGIRFPYQA
jgi:predicted nucleic acid-binding protein